MDTSFGIKKTWEKSRYVKGKSTDFKWLKKFDYKFNTLDVKTPIYSISAKGDTFIAPSIGCKMFLESFSNPDNIFEIYSTNNGNLENYDHSRISMSRNSAKEIWPSVLKWVEKNKR